VAVGGGDGTTEDEEHIVGELVVTQNITVDGVVEALGWFDAAGEDDGADLLDVVRGHMAGEAALLLGRQTFEDMRGYWPHLTDDTTGISAHLDDVAKYVVSSTVTDPVWAHSTVVTGDPVEEVRALKDRVDGTIGCTGSIRLVHALLAAGLVDEVRLFTYPVVVGRGRRLFPHGTGWGPLRLTESRAFRPGIVLTTYRAAR
jgi:dihydrofolate reductase